MDAAYLLEVFTLLVRWAHVIVAIAWIGASFYFVWLDNSLRPPTDAALKEKGVSGELWAVHGGGFYNPQKYLVAPAHLPADLHWFKWESYTTWITGFLLISSLYYLQAGSYMVDASKMALQPRQAIGVGVSALVVGWIVYDILCRLLIKRSQVQLGVIYYFFVLATAYVLTHTISGRAAFLHIGAMIATTMSANVFFWIIPGQKRVVAAMQRGEAPDPMDGIRAKQRSVHNNYLTLPVVFCMISNHFGFTYQHPHAWAILGLILLGAVLIRHWFNLRHKGHAPLVWPVLGCLLLIAAFTWTAPSRPDAPAPGSAAAAMPTPTVADIRPIIEARCAACHGAHPTLMPTPAAGLVFDSDEHLRQLAPRIHQQAVVQKAMPLGNVTKITDDERAKLGAWFERGAQ